MLPATRFTARLFHPSNRGFALIAALLMTAATVAIAVGLYVAASGARAGAVHTASGAFAEVIAKAGMERAEAWALASAKGRVDFDNVLDPALYYASGSPPDGEADCRQLKALGTGTLTETGKMNLPQFTGATDVTYPATGGKRYKVVSYQGGAYLVRFDDNDDDSIAAPAAGDPDWANRTGNNVRSLTNACYEGPGDFTALLGSDGVENRARDRDRVIWATVIGIYPGTDPEKAVHRAVLRKMLIDNRIVGLSAMQVRGNIDLGGGAQANLCTEVSGVMSGGFIDSGPPGTCGCGSVTADDVDLSAGQCSTCCGDNTLQTTETPTNVPAIPTYSDARWYDWSSACNFFVDPTTATPGLYFWDPTATRGAVGTCGAYTGALVAPSTDAANQGSCWVPLVRWATGATIINIGEISTGAAQEIVTPGGGLADWRPRNVATTYDIGPAVAAPSVPYYTANGTGTKPDWAQCPTTVATDFRWNPQSTGTGSGTEAIGCTTCTTAAAATVWTLLAAAPRWQLAAPTNTAIPAGVYVYNGAYSATWTGAFPTTLNPATLWPMMTLVVKDSLDISGGNRLWMGAGTRKNEFPSLIIGGNVNVESGSRLDLAGSIYVNGDFNVDSGGSNGAFLFGKVMVNGNLEVGPGGRLNWDYDTDLDALTVIPPPVPRLATPIPF